MKTTVGAKQVSLLEQLLALLREGRPRALAELAAELGTSPAMVEALVDELTRRGYLHELSAACCSGACQGCPLGGSCSIGGKGRVWGLEENQEG